MVDDLHSHFTGRYLPYGVWSERQLCGTHDGCTSKNRYSGYDLCAESGWFSSDRYAICDCLLGDYHPHSALLLRRSPNIVRRSLQPSATTSGKARTRQPKNQPALAFRISELRAQKNRRLLL